MLGGARGGSAVTPVDLHLDGLRTVIAENAAAAASCCCQTQGAIADAKYAALLNMKEMEMAAANCCLSFMAA